MGSVIAQACLRDSYTDWKLGYIYATAGMVNALTPSIGAMIGGSIMKYYSWHYVFIFLFYYSICSISLYILYLPETNRNIIGFNKNKNSNNHFLMITFSMLKDSFIVKRAMIIGLYNGILYSFLMQAPFIFQKGFNINIMTYGKMFIILTISNITGGSINRYLSKKLYKPSDIISYGIKFSLLGAISMIALAYAYKYSFFENIFNINLFTTNIKGTIVTNKYIILFGHNVEYNIFIVILLFSCYAFHLIGHTLIVPNILKDALKDYNKIIGSAGSVLGTLYYMVTSLITFIFSTLYSDSIFIFSHIIFSIAILAMLLIKNIKERGEL
ncbi:MAG TPA: MFS transporter [Candidatus Megaira endosymbiont of Hartmannula sinica]|nr:MFS transporter [Candidatus Megaera endosymbiont of Hartmannula sinica]